MKKLSPWLAVAGIWCSIGLFDASRTVFVMHAEGMHHDWPYLFLVLLLSWLVSELATPLVVRLERLRGWRAWVAHPLACLGIGIVSSAWIAFLEESFNPWLADAMPDFLTLWRIRFQENLLSFVILYATVLAVTFALRLRAQMMRQREVLTQARLDALRRQIEPHFLFNSLNSVVSLIREGRTGDADAAVDSGANAGVRELTAPAVDSGRLGEQARPDGLLERGQRIGQVRERRDVGQAAPGAEHCGGGYQVPRRL